MTVVVAGNPVAKAASNAPRAASGTGLLDGHPDFTGVYGSAGLPQGAQPPALKPGAEKFHIVRTANDIRGRTTLVSGMRASRYPSNLHHAVSVAVYPDAENDDPGLRISECGPLHSFGWQAASADPDPAWMGTAVGRWEGDTLVVESAGYNDKTEVHSFMHTESLHVIERFKKLENGNLQYDVTVEDPNVWAAPWVIPSRTFTYRPEAEWVAEFVCDAPPVDYQKLLGKD